MWEMLCPGAKLKRGSKMLQEYTTVGGIFLAKTVQRLMITPHFFVSVTAGG
jgi:hypothetical protein